MSGYQNILVVLDPTREASEQPALARAAQMSEVTQARLTLFVSIYDFSWEMANLLSRERREAMHRGMLQQRRKWVDELAAPLQAQGVTVDTVLVWHSRPFEAVLNQVKAGGHDLVIKSTHHHPRLKAVIFTPTDWHLLRKCPVPLLLAKTHDWPRNGKILVAINCGCTDETHAALNQCLTGVASRWAGILSAELHFVTVYPEPPANIAIEIPEFDAAAYSQAMLAHHSQGLAAHAARYQIPEARQHVIQGVAEKVIPALASEIDAEIVLTGTVGRTGLAGLLTGNTAEQIVDHLDADLLALPPAPEGG